jgi:hypothetical protein
VLPSLKVIVRVRVSGEQPVAAADSGSKNVSTTSSVASPKPETVPVPQRNASGEHECAVARPNVSKKLAENDVVVAAVADDAAIKHVTSPRSAMSRRKGFLLSPPGRCNLRPTVYLALGQVKLAEISVFSARPGARERFARFTRAYR